MGVVTAAAAATPSLLLEPAFIDVSGAAVLGDGRFGGSGGGVGTAFDGEVCVNGGGMGGGQTGSGGGTEAALGRPGMVGSGVVGWSALEGCVGDGALLSCFCSTASEGSASSSPNTITSVASASSSSGCGSEASA